MHRVGGMVVHGGEIGEGGREWGIGTRPQL